MKKSLLLLTVPFMMALSCSSPTHEPSALRAPAYPLVTIDPYTSAWSAADNLYDKTVTHWTGSEFPLEGIITVDGEQYRFMGAEEHYDFVLLPGLSDEIWESCYTLTNPGRDWYATGFDDSVWEKTKGAYGKLSPKRYVLNEWTSGPLWVRRHFDVTEVDEGAEYFLRIPSQLVRNIYVNGNEIKADENSRALPVPSGMLVKGDNVIAVKAESSQEKKGTLDFSLYTAKTVAPSCERTAVQTLADVQATQTYYAFDCGPVELGLTFSAPLYDLRDLDLMSRPVNDISYKISSKDGASHTVAISMKASDRWAINTRYQKTETDSFEKDGLVYVKAGSTSQNILGRRGDDLRIDWGYFYFSAPGATADNMTLTKTHDSAKKAEGHFLIGYDDIYSIQFFEQNLRPYWNRNEDRTIFDEFNDAEKNYKKDIAACTKFDAELMAECTAAGGRRYAELCALAYRQSIAAHKLVQLPNGEIDWFSKENFSNGSIGTVDVTYPSAPLFLRYNPLLAEGLMNHIFYYSEQGIWTKPFAAHDVGTYPQANGQTYGGDMPVEECGNMVVLTAATCAAKGDFSYAEKHWETLTTWTGYLEEYGMDPENQLCTDDFAGHFARNANLSVKAIMGIACYGYMAGKLGDTETCDNYMQKAREMAGKWMELDADGDHYGLVFESENTWSQKYNMVWDYIFGFDIFPKEVMEKEFKYYLEKQNKYGLPLDNRRTYTKSDWICWTATMADNDELFQAFINPLWDFYNETVSRVPMSDWYYTDSQKNVGFVARSVVGGYFIKLLDYKK